MLEELVKYLLKIKRSVGNKPDSNLLVKEISQMAVNNWVEGMKPNLTKEQFDDVLMSVTAKKWVNPN
jgi:hypothetical protein